MTSQQIKAEIAELKMDYIRLQGDMEKMESTSHLAMIEQAEQRLENMEVQLAELNKKLAAL